jgi:hypothetical protein
VRYLRLPDIHPSHERSAPDIGTFIRLQVFLNSMKAFGLPLSAGVLVGARLHLDEERNALTEQA